MNYLDSSAFDLTTEVMGGAKPNPKPLVVNRISEFPLRLNESDKQELHVQITYLNNLPYLNLCKFYFNDNLSKFIPVKKGGTCFPAQQWWQILEIAPKITTTLLQLGLAPPSHGNQIIISRMYYLKL